MPIEEFLKENDPDRYLLSLFVRDDAKRAKIVLFDALNVELSRLRDVIDTPHMGLIRLQWWRDEIKKIMAHQKPASHDILVSLSHTDLTGITFDEIYKMISAREADFIEYDGFDMLAYARDIHGPLLRLKAHILGEAENVDALAEAYALVGLLRAIPFYKARSQVVMADIQPAAVQKICDRAIELLGQNKVTQPYFKAHAVLARLYIGQIKKSGYYPDKIGLLPFKELRVWWGSKF